MSKTIATILAIGTTLFLLFGGIFIADKLEPAEEVIEPVVEEVNLGGNQKGNQHHYQKMDKKEFIQKLQSGQREFKNIELDNLINK